MMQSARATRLFRGFTILATLVVSACGGQAAPAEATREPAAATLPSTSEASTSAAGCQAPATPSTALTEGPYFKAGSPERTSLLEADTVGEHLQLSGFVFDRECTPLPGTKIEFWQADGNGAYDNAGYRLRGHQFTDANGAYNLTTVIPGEYPGRTEHIHVMLQTGEGMTLTTQLFFPDIAGNLGDGIFDPQMVIAMQATPDGWIGSYSFIIVR